MSRTRLRVNLHSIVASLAKWFSARLQTKWLWVRVQLQSHKFYGYCEIANDNVQGQFLYFIVTICRKSVSIRKSNLKFCAVTSTKDTHRIPKKSDICPRVFKLNGNYILL